MYNSFDMLVLSIILLVLLGVVSRLVYIAYYNNVNEKNDAIRVQEIWVNTPTLDEYASKFPNSMTKTGVRCARCNSNSLRNARVFDNSDDRVIICRHCNSRLYKIPASL